MSFSKLSQVFIVFLCLTIPSIGSTQTEVIFSEDFETGWGLWSADNGVWEVGTPVPSQGTPAPGPENCHQGSQCAGTILDGVSPDIADSRLISPSIILPEVAGNQEIHLRIWGWFSYSSEAGPSCDFGMVQVSIYEEGAWSEWTDTGSFVMYSSPSWSPLSVDLTQYAGTKMRIAFRHITSNYGCRHSSKGWYIDDVEIITNAVVAPCNREP